VAWLGIGIEETNAGIGIPDYRTKKMPDCLSLVRYRICSGIVSFFQSGTGLTGCRTVRLSGILKNFKRPEEAFFCLCFYSFKVFLSM
jgi:hypothetical protein